VFRVRFRGDLYGATLDIAFIAFIREELKFDNVAALVAQMNDDSAQARAALAAEPEAFPKLGVVGERPPTEAAPSSPRMVLAAARRFRLWVQLQRALAPPPPPCGRWCSIYCF